MEDILLNILILIHILGWIYVVFGGFMSENQNDIILYYIIPFVYIIHIAPFHVLVKTKLELIKNEYKGIDIDEESILHDRENNFIIANLFYKLREFFSFSFQNPLSPQGLLILGFIFNLYIKKYYWNAKKKNFLHNK